MAKEQKCACLAYNPTSGQEITKRSVVEMLDVLEGLGYGTPAFQTTPEPDSARDGARRATEAGFDLVIATGGDGTINEVANGIVPFSKRPQIAITPMGTTNDFACALKIPCGSPVGAVKIIGKDQTVQMDIGQVREDTYFISVATAGSFTKLTYNVPSQLETMFGYLAYLTKGIGSLPGIHMVPVRIKHERGASEDDISMIFATITNPVGSLEQVAPDAKLDDGKFTLILVETANLTEVLRLIRLVLDDGKYIGDKRIEYVKTDFSEVEPLSDKKVMINSDDEYSGDAPIKLRSLKGHITFFAGTDEISDDTLVWNQEDLVLEAIARKFTQEVGGLSSKG